jgi:hypothetical protein
MSWASLADPRCRPLAEINRPVPPLLEHAVIYAPCPAEHVSRWMAKIGERRKRFKGFIPNVIWTIVMSMLVTNDLISISKVSRQLHRVAALPECWQSRGLMIARTPYHVEHLKHHIVAKVVSNSFLAAERTLLLDSSSRCNFNTIFINEYNSIIVGDSTRHILRCSPCLRHLSLEARFETIILEQLPQVRLATLSLVGFFNENNIDMSSYRQVFLSQADSLKSLHITDSSFTGTLAVLETLGSVLDRFHVLKSLEITLSTNYGNINSILERNNLSRTLRELSNGIAANSSIEKLNIRINTSLIIDDQEMVVLLATVAHHLSLKTLCIDSRLKPSTIRDMFAGSKLSYAAFSLTADQSMLAATPSDKPYWSCLRKLQLTLFNRYDVKLFKEPWMPNLEELTMSANIYYRLFNWQCGELYGLLESLEKGYPKLQRLDLVGISTIYLDPSHDSDNDDENIVLTPDAYMQLYRAAFAMAMKLLTALPDLVIENYPCSEHWYQPVDEDDEYYYELQWQAYNLVELRKIADEHGVDMGRVNRMKKLKAKYKT